MVSSVLHSGKLRGAALVYHACIVCTHIGKSTLTIISYRTPPRSPAAGNSAASEAAKPAAVFVYKLCPRQIDNLCRMIYNADYTSCKLSHRGMNMPAKASVTKEMLVDAAFAAAREAGAERIRARTVSKGLHCPPSAALRRLKDGIRNQNARRSDAVQTGESVCAAFIFQAEHDTGRFCCE